MPPVSSAISTPSAFQNQLRRPRQARLAHISANQRFPPLLRGQLRVLGDLRGEIRKQRHYRVQLSSSPGRQLNLLAQK
jgi:hypothetical protein